MTGLTIQNGRYLIYDNDGIFPDDDLLARLSKNASLTLCQVNETVMFSTAHAWKNGVEVWSVFHDANQGIDHLETTGDVPDSLDRIREKQMTLQSDCDDVCVDFIFDIPVTRLNPGTAYTLKIIKSPCSTYIEESSTVVDPGVDG